MSGLTCAREQVRADRGASQGHREPPGNGNKLRWEDRTAHDWYRFVLSYPPHLVRRYLERFNVTAQHRVLDPFCGTGTTLVECKKLGIPSVGVERNPVACFASRTKVDWNVDPDALLAHARRIGEVTTGRLASEGIDDSIPTGLFETSRERAVADLRTLPREACDLLLEGSISPLPLHKVLVLLDTLERHAEPRFAQHERLALAKVIAFRASNLTFGPEVGVGPPKDDSPVIAAWLEELVAMVGDLRCLRCKAGTEAVVHEADSRHVGEVLEPRSVDAVITSPPYPNEKDYTRTTRLESVLLGFIRSKRDLRLLKQGLVRSNTRGVYKNDSDDLLVEGHPEIQRIAETIEKRRVELGKTSGFERLHPRVTRLYFGGMARHLAELRAILRPGARLAYVVGDQASYLRVMIRTGHLLADIACSLGYRVTGIELFRTRLATATKELLREEVVLLTWPEG